MTQQFKAPPVPKPLSESAVFKTEGKVTPVVDETKKTEPEKEYGLYDDNFAADLNLPAKFLKTSYIMGLLGCTLLIGLFVGCSFGGDNTTSSQGLGGVVANQDLVEGRSYQRCGTVSKGEECLLYLMNSSRQDKYAETFFPEAERMTEVPKYLISTANIQYAKRLIRPGYFVQLIIPRVK